MSCKIEIISSGYSRWQTMGETMCAKGSSTLIKGNQMNVLFDTMGPFDKNELIDKLLSFNVIPDDINKLICSHTHVDHIGNINLFTNCQHIVADHVYYKDVYQLNTFQTNKTIDISKDMQIVSTPGHTLNDISLIVKNVDKLGTIGITGDLFECESDLKDDEIWISAGTQSKTEQMINRNMILEMCDYIIPGHGIMFKVHK